MNLCCKRIRNEFGTFHVTERHSNTEMPTCYPDEIIEMDGMLGLVNPHSPKYYHPTSEARAKLETKICASKGWFYLDRIRENRQRST